MLRCAVVLAGCGVFDGSEIHEAVCTLISIKKNGGEYVCFSPDKLQYHVINHRTSEPSENEIRNVLLESARISRGEIKTLNEYKPEDFDALIFPGGFGVAKNLFTYVIDGADCEIDEEVKDVIIKTHQAGKYIGAMCIATVLIARAFKGTDVHPKVAVGNVGLAEAIKLMGGEDEECDVTNACIDSENRIVTTPAYLSATNIYEVFEGANAMILAIKNSV